ncbi:metalloregulator ArsR/SmtB family transcription factor [Microbulbifer pacificus]|uniref:metalloregulator ArsR/SmtB family transcription factor n=1 Tax=Microbulbifer pacificus TaxID=407164 RepID=UPI0018F871B8|nr:metalloregulator ArsR/SmtB family transcription factor [Microbulbifer pacificus]
MTPVQLFKCLADETRLRLVLLMFSEGELCVCELMAALEESQPKISRHLAQLRNCGLLQDTRRGQWVYYAIHPSLPEWARAVCDSVLTDEPEWLAVLQNNLKAMVDRPICC